jgi:hypothetical protein
MSGKVVGSVLTTFAAFFYVIKVTTMEKKY